MESKDVATTAEGQDMFGVILANLEKWLLKLLSYFQSKLNLEQRTWKFKNNYVKFYPSRKSSDKVSPNDSVHSENFGFIQAKSTATVAIENPSDKNKFKLKRKTMSNPTKSTKPYAHIKSTDFHRD